MVSFSINLVIVSVTKNLRKTKSLNTNNQKCKKKQVQTNTDTLDPYDLFSRGLRRSMKWKPTAYYLVKNKNRYRKEEDVEACREFDRNCAPFDGIES